MATHIKKIASARAASLYDSNEPLNTPRKKKAKTSVMRSNKGSHKRLVSTTLPSAIACFARSQECLSKRIYHIVLMTVQVSVPTGPSRINGRICGK